jgi:hypothetical protein
MSIAHDARAALAPVAACLDETKCLGLELVSGCSCFSFVASGGTCSCLAIGHFG